MTINSYREIIQLLHSIRKKVADALWHEHRGESAAAKAIKSYAIEDLNELRRAWAEAVGGELPSYLGRHIGFWMEGDFYDILRLDLPEIEAALDKAVQRPAKNEPPSELSSLLHPTILKHGYAQLVRGDLHGAVLSAFIAVFDLIRSRTGRTDDGERLITGVFSEKNPSLVFSEIETIAGRDDQVGFMQILQGAYRGIRSPKAHSLNHDLTPHSAAQYLVFASLLARRIEAAVQRTPSEVDPEKEKKASNSPGPERPIQAPPIITDKFVSLAYVERVGITAQVREEGFEPQWVRADGEAEAVELDGCSYVEGRDESGSTIHYKVADAAVRYLVLVKKKPIADQVRAATVATRA